MKCQLYEDLSLQTKANHGKPQHSLQKITQYKRIHTNIYKFKASRWLPLSTTADHYTIALFSCFHLSN